MTTSTDDMLDWMPVVLTEEEAWELLSQYDENGELI